MSQGTIPRRVSTLPVLAIAAFGMLPSGFAASDPKEQIEMQKEGVEQIRNLEEVAREIRYHADRLNGYARTLQISRWTHIHHLEKIKALVNGDLKPTLDRLVEIQPHLPEWKQASIDRMLASAREMAADTNSAIMTKNESANMPLSMNAEYKEFIAQVYEHADSLVKTSDVAGSYAAAKLKAAEAGLVAR